MLIYGASGHAHELANLIEVSGCQLASYVDDFSSGPMIMRFEEAKARFIEIPMIVGVGSPKLRRRLAEQAKTAGFIFVPKLVHPRVELSHSIQIGVGSVISAGCILTVDIHMGEHTHLNIASSISHDVWMGDYVTICPGAGICGNVRIEDDVFVGAGATIIQGVSLGKGSIIGAGACVTKSVPPGETWVGVPARPVVKK